MQDDRKHGRRLFAAVHESLVGTRTDMPTLLSDVRCWGQSGKHLFAASISPFDPVRTSARARCMRTTRTARRYPKMLGMTSTVGIPIGADRFKGSGGNAIFSERPHMRSGESGPSG